MTPHTGERTGVRIHQFCFLFGCCLGWLAVAEVAIAQQEALSYEVWRDRCLKTPSNRTLRGRLPTKQQLPLKDFGVVQAEVDRVLQVMKNGPLSDMENWIGEKPDPAEFLDVRRSYFQPPPIPFQPFAQKLTVKPGSQLILHGDFHGDIRSFIASLDWLTANGHLTGFHLKDPNTYLVFLGDYVDRGAYGIEVMYTLYRLKLANPDRVIMARGNHEDFQMTATYGFLREGQVKYGRSFVPRSMWRMYDFLPVVIYIGCGDEFAQCNHGGMEAGFDPAPLLNADGENRFQLLGRLNQKTFLAEQERWIDAGEAAAKSLVASKFSDFEPKSPVNPTPIGFMWNDFTVFPDEPAITFNENRLAFNFGRATTHFLMEHASRETAQLRTVFRAHQHSSVPNPMMHRLIVSRGAFRHWQAKDGAEKATVERSQLSEIIDTGLSRKIPEGSVWTFNVSPDSVYGEGNDYGFDTIGIVQVEEKFDDWRLRVVNVPVPSE